ncbi:MAG: glutamine synthetase type III, partial [Erysipelotrichaceae bacterium]|nr:glutamine synthetase type III [Erysipelotrichaceae bacterium]
FLGDELNNIIEALDKDIPYTGVEKVRMKLGVHALPKFFRDTTDRNRTSPFAFTGNKFEFRMLGSSNSIACANIMLNSAVADSFKKFADELEKAEDFEKALHDLIRKTIKEHKRIIFNGNGYDDTWIEEAVNNRGLLNYRTTADCIPHLLDKKNVDMLISQRIYVRSEITSRYEITLENYVKTILIEANTMIDMAKSQIIPSVINYTSALAETANKKKKLCEEISVRYEFTTVKKLSGLVDEMCEALEALEQAVGAVNAASNIEEQANLMRDLVLVKMDELRKPCDEAETMTDKAYWPYPSYGDLLFGVR